MARRLVVAVGLALVGCAARAPVPVDADEGDDAGSCFDVGRVAGWGDAGPSRIRVRVGREAYDLELQGPQCADVVYWPAIAIESGTGSPWVCVTEGEGDEVGLGEVHFTDGPSGRALTCRIARVTRP